MASDHEASCESDPNFAVICGFLEKFGETCGLSNVDFLDLQCMLENNNEVPQQLIDLHVKLLRKARKSVSSERWERALVKVCHGYGSQDAWEIERFGYRKARLPAKLRILKQLLEMQFDYNAKFKTEINKLSAEELRTQPLGRDRLGHAYWFQADDNCQIRVYKEDPDEETWALVAKDRNGLVNLISQLTDGKEEALVNEDSNSLESEKPVVDTGQNNVTDTKTDEKETNGTVEQSPSSESNDIELKINTNSEQAPDLKEQDTLPPKDSEPVMPYNNQIATIESGKENTEIEDNNTSLPVSHDMPKEVGVDDMANNTFSTHDLKGAPVLDDVPKTIQQVSETTDTSDEFKVIESVNEVLDTDTLKTDELEKDILIIPTAISYEKIDTNENSSCNTDAVVKSYLNPLQNVASDLNENQNTPKNVMPEIENVQTGLNLSLKPLPETSTEPNKRLETFGVKEKYMRSDMSSVTSSVHRRKAVDSAGYSLHTKYLKSRMREDEEVVEEPAYTKRPRFDRPTLLGYRKKKNTSSESNSDDEYEQNVSDEVEEPLMLVKGEGSGYENKDGNLSQELNKLVACPIIGEIVEEPIMYFQGEGSGHDCETGKDDSDKESSVLEHNDSMPLQLKDSVDDSCSNIKLNVVNSSELKQTVTNISKNLESDITGTESQSSNVDNCTPNITTHMDNKEASNNCQATLLDDKLSTEDDTELKTAEMTSTNKTVLDEGIGKDIADSENITNDLVVDKKYCILPLNDKDSHEASKPDGSIMLSDQEPTQVLKSCEILEATPESDCTKKVQSDKNFSIYLEEKSRISSISTNCTDIVNNLKQSSAKSRPKKILNYRPKNDRNYTNKTDNIKLEDKEIKALDIKCDDSSNKQNLLINEHEKKDCADLDNGPIDEGLHCKTGNASEMLDIPEKCILNTNLAEIEHKTISDAPDNQNKNAASLNKSNIDNLSDTKDDDSKLSKTVLDSNKEDVCEPPQSTRSTRSTLNLVDKLGKTSISIIPTNSITLPKLKSQKTTLNCNQNKVVPKISKTKISPPVKTKRDLRQRSFKGNNALACKKGKKGIVNDSNRNSNNKKSVQEVGQEADITDGLCHSTTLESSDQVNNLDNSDDDMEIDDSVNNKTIDIIEMERQIVKPSEINLAEPLEMKTITIEQETINVIQNSKRDDIPVNEPKCTKKKMPLLTCIDINKLKGDDESNDAISDEIIDSNLQVISTIVEPAIKKEPEINSIAISDSESCEKSSDVVVVGDSEPLTLSEESDRVSKKYPTTITGFKIDVEDAIPAARLTRKRAAEQNANNTKSSKRPKMKGKRSLDNNLRRSIEEQKLKEMSSSDDEAAKKKSPRIVKKKNKRRASKLSEADTDRSEQSSDSISDSSNTVNKRTKPAPRRKTLLGLDISSETENIIKGDADLLTGIRQSRRIAQIKIKEEAERRKLEELALQEHKEEQRKHKSKKSKDKDYKSEQKKHRKRATTEEETTNDVDSEEKKKRKKKRKHGQFDVHKPWRSSTGSSSSEIEEEEDEPEPEPEEDHHIFKSDHEFSPESDLEKDTDWMPLKRARTVRKEIIESDTDEQVDDCPCQKCGKSDHPEWILLCDSCDSGWHCSCLRPPLLVIPEGDWFCPPCQHTSLVKNIQSKLVEYDKKISKKEMEVRRKERLAYVGISLDNVLPAKEHDEKRHKLGSINNVTEDSESDSDSDSDSSDSDSKSSSSSVSDNEPIYQLRERRQAHSYRFNDYDDLINSAIQDELDAVKGAGNQGRGKDISTIVNAKNEEHAQSLQQGTVAVNGDQPIAPIENIQEPLPSVVPIVQKSPTLNDSDDEPIRPIKKYFGRKKHRKLNSLDISSEDDAESDEDFKGSSSSESDEDFDDEESDGTESSDEKGTRGGKRRKDYGPIRRSTRARISRYDRDFVNDDSDSGGGKKKSRFEWEETESEESDGSWGRRKRRNATSKRKQGSSSKSKKSKKKKKKRNDDSDPEVYKRKPKLKFGGLNDPDEFQSRKTRGKKINYLEALGTDSEEDLRRKPPKIDDSEEEYIVQDDEAFKNHLNSERNSEESDIETALQGIPAVPSTKPRGRGKSGLKIARSLQEEVPLFPPVAADAPAVPLPGPPPPLPPLPPDPPLDSKLDVESPVIIPPIPNSVIADQDTLDTDDEPNPIELINKNVEAMDEHEMKKMMEEEDYANKQLQLLALQIEKERKRKEREAQRLEKMAQLQRMAMQAQAQKLSMPNSNLSMPAHNLSMQIQNIPTNIQNAPTKTESALSLAQVQAPLPLSQIQATQNTPKKRGRKPKSQTGTPVRTKSVLPLNQELSDPVNMALPAFNSIAPGLDTNGAQPKRRGRGKGKKTLAAEAAANASTSSKESLELDASSNSNTAPSPSPGSPMHGSKLGVAAPPQPFSQSPAPSVITRMLQSQPGQKYFGGFPGPRGPYQQPPPHYPVVRSGPAPPHRLPQSLPPMYHPHRSVDPSPSGGGPINLPPTTISVPAPARSSSPLSKGETASVPPPPYATSPQLSLFSPGNVPAHLQHRLSNIPPPFHPGTQATNFYGPYGPPLPAPPLNAENEAPPPPPVYPGSYEEQYAPGDATTTPVPLTVPPENSNSKQFDEETTSGEFGGLVSYFSSQREDDLDT